MNRRAFGVLALIIAFAAAPAVAEKHQQGSGPAHMGGAPRMGGGMPRTTGPRFNVERSHPMARERAPAFRERSTIGVHERSGFGVRERSFRGREVVSGHRGREVIVRHSSPKFARFHRVTRAPRRFHVGIYHRPHGWFRHHWRLGERLPRAWFGRSYWITDWGLYGLWAPYDGLVWVRVGPDAFLIDPYTGEVVSIEYGIFW